MKEMVTVQKIYQPEDIPPVTVLFKLNKPVSLAHIYPLVRKLPAFEGSRTSPPKLGATVGVTKQTIGPLTVPPLTH
jgi:hypothetical protein